MSGPGCKSLDRDDCRVVEIVGPPGAGKSTLARTLVSSGDDVRLVRTYFGRRNLLPWVHAAVPLLPILSGSFPGSHSTTQRRWTLRIAASHEILQRASEGARLLLLDQGPLFAMLSLMEAVDVGERSPLWQRWWRQELSMWAATLDSAIVLDAPDDVLLERIRARAKGHVFKNRPEAEVRKAMAMWRALLEDLIAEVRTYDGLEVHRLNTGNKPTDAVVAGAMSALGFGIAQRTPAASEAPEGAGDECDL